MLTRMAREERDREDLLREATALVERVELAPAIDPAGEHVVIGFRADGAASIYFGGDSAYHFNASGELRRAHHEGLLYKAEDGRLVSLERTRQDNQVQLLRRPLSEIDQAAFITTMQEWFRTIANSIAARDFVAVGQVPAEVDVIGRAVRWLDNIATVAIAHSPHAR